MGVHVIGLHLTGLHLIDAYLIGLHLIGLQMSRFWCCTAKHGSRDPPRLFFTFRRISRLLLFSFQHGLRRGGRGSFVVFCRQKHKIRCGGSKVETIVRLLLGRDDIDPNIEDCNGRTPPWWAVRRDTVWERGSSWSITWLPEH